MSNLGLYQTVVTVLKKLGGPAKAIPIILGTTGVAGYGLGKGGEVLVKKGAKALKRRDLDAKQCREFDVLRAGDDADAGIVVKLGDRYRVMERDGDAVLIEVLGDSNSPYFVSTAFLRSVSDYPADHEDHEDHEDQADA